MVLRLILNLLFLLFLIVQAWAQEPQPLEVNGAVGGVAFLNPHSPQDPSKYSRVHWRWENRVTIAIRTRGKEPTYPSTRFWGRLELFDNHTLKMSELNVRDSSEYQLYLEDDAGQESVQQVQLRVYDLVPKPHVEATARGNAQQCNITLNCSVSLQDVTYEWIPLQKLPRNNGPILNVSFSPAMETYMCRVSNPVSSNNASLTYRPLCRWTGESSSIPSATPSTLLGLLFLLLLVA